MWLKKLSLKSIDCRGHAPISGQLTFKNIKDKLKKERETLSSIFEDFPSLLVWYKKGQTHKHYI